MQSSYEAWARYDVEKELRRVEERDREDEQRRIEARKVQEKRHVEASISLDAEQSADVLAAHAAVAALKTKGRGRRRGEGTTGAGDPSNQSEQTTAACAPAPEKDAVSDADTLRRHAERLKTKHELIESIRRARCAGDDLLQRCGGGATDWSAAKERYERALASVRELRDLIPELEEAERQADVVRGRHKNENSMSTFALSPGGSEAHEKGCAASDHHDHHDHYDHHDHGHTKKECGCHRSAPHNPPDHSPSLQEKAKDLAGVVDHFHQECFMGIGVCELSMGRFAAASEAFKEVLLKDDKQLLAWRQRGRAFEKMGTFAIGTRVMEVSCTSICLSHCRRTPAGVVALHTSDLHCTCISSRSR
ncbi:hypothetical protein PINS_up005718 [Pythium insidiosum]|nr:hypothetical protein PINS_up005718 [Pythium insidiosum]